MAIREMIGVPPIKSAPSFSCVATGNSNDPVSGARQVTVIPSSVKKPPTMRTSEPGSDHGVHVTFDVGKMLDEF